MTRFGFCITAIATAVFAFAITATAGADVVPTTSASTPSGYQVTLTGPVSAVVGQPTTYTATCGGGYACPYGAFRAFGGVINRLGEGFGVGATGTYTFRAPGNYAVRYRMGASCPGSPRTACPISVFVYTTVTA